MDLKKVTSIVKEKITNLNIDSLDISQYNKRYLKHYQQNLDFYLDSYSQLLSRALSKLDRPVNETVFLDYGGGSGLLSYLAVSLGFKSVIYNDLYKVSVNDVKIISHHLQLNINEYIAGDINQVIETLKSSNTHPDLICSFDVLEHIYDWKQWFNQLKALDHPFKLFFKTSANGSNPFVRKRLEKLQINAELYDREKKEGWKEIDLSTSFLNERKKIIAQHFPALNENDISNLSTLTRGLKESDIVKEVTHFINNGKMEYKITHPTNTCDPYTGNWTENMIDTDALIQHINSLGFKCSISNSLYPYSEKIILNLPKLFLNLSIRLLGKKNLFFSPSYTVELEHNI